MKKLINLVFSDLRQFSFVRVKLESRDDGFSQDKNGDINEKPQIFQLSIHLKAFSGK